VVNMFKVLVTDVEQIFELNGVNNSNFTLMVLFQYTYMVLF